MGTFGDYLKKKKQTNTGRTFGDYLEERKKSKAEEIAPVKETKTSKQTEDIAPVASTEKKGQKNSYFQKGALEDGVTVGNVVKGARATRVDIKEDAAKGILGLGERVWDGVVTLMPTVMKIINNQTYKNGGFLVPGLKEMQDDAVDIIKEKIVAPYVAADVIKEEEIARKIITEPFERKTGINVEESSYLGSKGDELVQSAADMLARQGLNLIVPGAGIATTGLSSFGGEAENAFQNNATYEEAVLSGAVSAAAEMGSEYLFGGIKFGGKTLTDSVTKGISKGISNKVLATLAKWGFNTVGEGAEEVISGIMTAVGQKLTYANEKEFNELFSKEDAWENFLAGAILGGAFGGASVVNSSVNPNAKDYVTERNKNEQKVFDKLYQEMIAEQETDGEKITSQTKSDLYDSLDKFIKKGYVDTDQIESILGGKTYEAYAEIEKKANTLIEEANKLQGYKKRTKKQEARLEEIRSELQTVLPDVKNAKLQLMKEVSNKVKGTNLFESYRELERSTHDFEIDLDSIQDENARKTAENFLRVTKSGNTNQAHDFLDLCMKVSTDRGHVFHYVTKEEMREIIKKDKRHKNVDGSRVEGFYDEATNDIYINIDANKSLNSLVGHEVMHGLENTQAYKDLVKQLESHSKKKGDYGARVESVKSRYAEEDVEYELAADMLGDYIFDDSDFIKSLAKENPKGFKKILENMEYLGRMATAGSKQKRAIEKAKRELTIAWRESQNAAATEDSDMETDTVHFSISDKNAKKTLSNSSDKGYNKYKTSHLFEQVVRKKHDTKQNTFLVNDFENYYDVEVDEDYNYKINNVISISGNEDYIKELQRRRRENANHNRTGISGNIDNSERVREFDDRNNATTEREQTWAEFIDEILEKYKSEGTDGIGNSQESARNSQGNKYSLREETSSEDGVFFDAEKEPKTRFSISDKDSNGNQLTKGQKDYFAQSKAVDKNGNLVQVHHGTVREFYTFDKEYANPEGDMGKGFYFTNDAHDVDRNYANFEGVDLTNKIEQEADLLENEEEYQDMAHDEIVEILREKYITVEEPISLDCYLNITNPVYVGKNETYLLSDIYENYDMEDFESEDEYQEAIDQILYDIVDDVMYHINNNIELWTDTGEIGNILYESAVEGGITLATLKEKLNEAFIEDVNGKIVSNEVARLVVEALGYDGIIDTSVSKKFSNMGLNHDTVHYVVFDSSQAKLVTNENPTTNKDIRKSIASEKGEFDSRFSTHASDLFRNSKYDAKFNTYSQDDIAPLPGWNVKGSDIAYEDIGPVREDTGHNQEEINERHRITMEEYANDSTPIWNNVEYADEETKRTITQQIHEEMVSSGAVVEVSADTMQKVGESFPDLRSMKKKDRTPILKESFNKLKSNLRQFLGGISNQGFEFEVNGAILDARLYSTGINEVLEKLTQDKAGMLYSTEEIFKNARYLYSTPDYDGDSNVYRWNYFYTPVQIGEQIVGVRIAVRDMVKPSESQIYNWGIKKDTSLDGVGHGVNTRSPHGVSSDVSNNIISDTQKNTSNIFDDDMAAEETSTSEVQPKTRKELHKNIVDRIKSTFSSKGFDFDEVLKKAHNLSTLRTVDNTPQRVMEKSLGYTEGGILSDLTVNKVAQNESEGIKWLNSFTNRKSGLLAQISKQYNIKPGSEESAAAQMYAEGFYVDENNNIVEYGDKELAKDFPDITVRENIKGLSQDGRIRQIYDETLSAINESRVRNGYKEIPRLDNYFLHFRAMDDTFSRMGLPFNPNDIKAKDLPTVLNQP